MSNGAKGAIMEEDPIKVEEEPIKVGWPMLLRRLDGFHTKPMSS